MILDRRAMLDGRSGIGVLRQHQLSPSPSVVLDGELILGLSCNILPAGGRDGVLKQHHLSPRPSAVLDGELIPELACSVLPAREWNVRVVIAPAVP